MSCCVKDPCILNLHIHISNIASRSHAPHFIKNEMESLQAFCLEKSSSDNVMFNSDIIQLDVLKASSCHQEL